MLNVAIRSSVKFSITQGNEAKRDFVVIFNRRCRMRMLHKPFSVATLLWHKSMSANRGLKYCKYKISQNIAKLPTEYIM